MTARSDMSTPVTRGELREELEQLEGRVDHKLEQLAGRFDQKLEQLAGRFDQKLEQLEGRVDHKLEMWGGALLARIESSEHRLSEAISKAIASSEQRMSAELARHAKAIGESVATRIVVIDEKYADLPARVSRLEALVSDPDRNRAGGS